MGASRNRIATLLEMADIAIDGSRPWDLQVRNSDLYRRVLCGGSLAFGEAYMEGWWECDRLDELFYRLLRAGIEERVKRLSWYLTALRARLCNLQKPSRAFTVGTHHYDIGNELYACMLDSRLIYSCACWDQAETLDAAQEAKLDMVCRKLNLQPGMRVLDIGCGWGGAAKFAAERYGVKVVGVTVSRQQAAHAQQVCRGLPVEIRLQDYRAVTGSFDRIFSIGMFEHVGSKNYRTFMRTARGLLRDDGLLLLHTIGTNVIRACADPWITRYVFPNSMLPSASQIAAVLEERFVLEDWHVMGHHYDRTLMQWYRNFQEGWDRLRHRYDSRFHRMWTYYLLSCAGAFRARSIQVWQIVASPAGIVGGYAHARAAFTTPSPLV